MPDWVIAVEALVVALLVHAVLFVLAGHQPEARGSAVPRSPGVTLWTRSGLPAEEWRKLARWTEVHNPALMLGLIPLRVMPRFWRSTGSGP